MAYADHVPQELWNQRYDWLRETEEKEAGTWGSILLSAQGTLLSYDVEIAFCAGAWISVLVLSHAAIDATIRDTETSDYKLNSKSTFGSDTDLQWLRITRNKLVHVSDPDQDEERAQKMLDDVASFHTQLEDDARRAVSLMYRCIYANPGT